MADSLAGIIEKTARATPLRRRRAKETLRSVFRVDGFIVKEFDIPAKCRRYRKPWLTEIRALKRMGDDYPGSAIGVAERIDGDVRRVFFVKRFMDGVPLESVSVPDVPAIARLLAGIHANGVITDDAHADNFLRTPSGEFAFIDFGRAMVFGVRPAPAFAVGKELAKLYREGFGYDKEVFAAFLREYYGETHSSRLRRMAIALGMRTTIFLRTLRKGKGK